MLWAVCVMCFFGFFHLGELVSISSQITQNTLLVRDIAVDNTASPTILEVCLRHSKTDCFGSGVSVFLGRSFNELCPLAALLAYIAVRGGADGPLFCHPDGAR